MYSNGSSISLPSYQPATTRTCVPVGSVASATSTIFAASASATCRTSERRNSSPTAPAVPSATALSSSWPRSRGRSKVGAGIRQSYPAARGGSGRQAELAGAARGLHARAAVELAQDVPHVHVDRARAEEQVLRDLPVGAARGHELDDLTLAPRQPAAVGVGDRAPPQPVEHGLAERGDLLGRLEGQ